MTKMIFDNSSDGWDKMIVKVVSCQDPEIRYCFVMKSTHACKATVGILKTLGSKDVERVSTSKRLREILPSTVKIVVMNSSLFYANPDVSSDGRHLVVDG